MPYSSPLIDDLDRLRKERPDWPFSDILKKRATETYLRHGEIEPIVKSLIPLAEEFEAQHSTALKDHPLAMMKALADALVSKTAIAKNIRPIRRACQPVHQMVVSGRVETEGERRADCHQVSANSHRIRIFSEF